MVMKKIILLLFMFLFCLKVSAADTKTLPYKNIKQNSHIYYTESDGWTIKRHKNVNMSFVRTEKVLFADDKDFAFDTNCDYLFITNGVLVGYSASELNFYKFIFNESHEYMLAEAMSQQEVAQMFKEFRIILISDFSSSTNSFVINKKRGKEKIMLLNDTELSFDNYGFTSNNTKYKKYCINNAIEASKKGLIQFSKMENDTNNTPWFILLVR